MDFPFDADKIAYAYVTSEFNNGFGHLHLNLCLPSLARLCGHYPVTLTLHNQCSERDWGKQGIEPFYAIRLEACQSSSGMDMENCERAAKTMRKLQKDIAKIDAVAGSPAVLLEDLMLRYILAAKIEHVYCEPSVRTPGNGIADWPHYTPRGDNGMSIDSLRSQLIYMKGQLLVKTGFRDAA